MCGGGFGEDLHPDAPPALLEQSWYNFALKVRAWFRSRWERMHRDPHAGQRV